MAKYLNKIENTLYKGATAIAVSGFVAIVAFISINVISRFLFKRSFNWAEEVAYLCFNWVVFLGVAIVYRYQGLTAIDLVVNRLKGNVKKTVLAFGYTLVSLTNVGLIVWGIQFSIKAWERKSPALHIPYFFYDLSIPVAAVLLLICSVRFLVMTLHGEDVESASLEN